jgi:SAM-dependent MidA family methyltransferase
MDTGCRALIVERIRQHGLITVAGFMDLALYAPDVGYYARAARRSGRAGDFFTSVDVGPMFGTLLESRFAALWAEMGTGGRGPDPVDLVEAGAGNGRLSLDVLDAASRRHPDFYRAIALHLVERSTAARAAHASSFAAHAARLASSGGALPDPFDGILFANELLDAFPVHVVEMTESGLREVYVDVAREVLVPRLGPPSTPRLAAYLAGAGVTLEPGWRAEVNLAAVDWVGHAAERLRRGFLLLVDYGHEAAELYSAARAQGTLTAFHRHLVDPPAADGSPVPAWLADPGSRDLTSHVDLTSIRHAAVRAGLEPICTVSQTRFLLDALERGALVEELSDPDRARDRLALKTLLIPGGLGSTHRVMLFAKR